MFITEKKTPRRLGKIADQLRECFSQRPLLNSKQTIKPLVQACQAESRMSERDSCLTGLQANTHTHIYANRHTYSSATKEQVSKSLVAARPGRPGETEGEGAETDAVEKYCCSSPLRDSGHVCARVSRLWKWQRGSAYSYMCTYMWTCLFKLNNS